MLMLLALFFGAQQAKAQNDAKATELIKSLEKAAGGWNALWDQKDVEFEYDYSYPAKGVKDFSVERYIFDGEHSWAKYTTHQVNIMPKEEGVVEMGLVNNVTTMTKDGEPVTDEKVVGTADFLRRANFFWFTMNFKLANPGTIHKYLGQEELAGITYEKVEVTYDSEETGKKNNDTYILYINPETSLVDQFYFSLPDFGVTSPVLKMKVTYSEINGLQIPARRDVWFPNDQGAYSEDANLVQKSLNIKFNNGFKPEDLKV